MRAAGFIVVVALSAGVAVAQDTFHPSARALVKETADWDALLRGETLTSTEEVPGSAIPRATARAVIEAPPQKVWALVSDCASYKRTMPRISDSELIKREGDEFTCRIVADMPFPMSNLTNLSRARHTVVDGVFRREWKMIEGNYKTNTGSWTVAPLDAAGTRTLVIYTIHADPDVSVPKFMVKEAMRRTLPDLITRVRAQVK